MSWSSGIIDGRSVPLNQWYPAVDTTNRNNSTVVRRCRRRFEDSRCVNIFLIIRRAGRVVSTFQAYREDVFLPDC